MPRITTKRAAVAAALLYATSLLATFGPLAIQRIIATRVFGVWP